MSGTAVDGVAERVLTTLLAMQRQSWEQGVTGHAALDLGRSDLVRAVARDAVTRQAPDGRLAEIDAAGLVNSAAAGEAVLEAASAAAGTPAGEELAQALDRQVRWLLQDCPRAQDGTLFHLAGTREVWVDTVYMVVPLLVATGHVAEAAAQVDGHRRRLFDEGTGLYAARWDEDAGRRCDPRAWGTGNGWVVAALARALRGFGAHSGAHPGAGPEADFHRAAAGHARRVLDACLEHRRPDGVFTDVVDDPTTFSEANLAQMLAFACFTGAADGWLPPGYAGVGRSLLAAARARVDEAGFVTGVCGAPRFDRQGTSAEAQAFFLLATAAEARLRSLTAPAQR
jgi:unsaturated rhamnogalacturonyl hydrolase